MWRPLREPSDPQRVRACRLNCAASPTYDDAVRAAAKVLVVTGIAVALLVAVLYVAVPPNTTPEQGSADPILFARRPVFKLLGAVGLIKFDERLPNPYLPAARSTTTWEELPTGQRLLTSRTETKHEPAYRGLFWPVGRRVTYSLEFFGELRESWRTVRLCYAVGGQRFVAAENAALQPGGQLAQVSGFVPRTARCYWVEQTNEEGEVHSLEGWGDTDPFWRD